MNDDYANTVDFRHAWKVVSEMGKVIEKGDFLSVTREQMDDFDRAVDLIRNEQTQNAMKECYEIKK